MCVISLANMIKNKSEHIRANPGLTSNQSDDRRVGSLQKSANKTGEASFLGSTISPREANGGSKWRVGTQRNASKLLAA